MIWCKDYLISLFITHHNMDNTANENPLHDGRLDENETPDESDVYRTIVEFIYIAVLGKFFDLW